MCSIKRCCTCLFLGGYCLSVVSGEAAGLKVGDVNPLINPVFGNGVTLKKKKKLTQAHNQSKLSVFS